MVATKQEVTPSVEPSAEPAVKPFAETLKIAAYGANNSRKTLQIGHLIETYGAANVGIISCEHGLNTIGSLLDERYIRVVDSRDDLRKAYGWAKETFTSPSQWVCVDGGTRVIQWLHNEVFGTAQRAYEAVLNGVPKKNLPADLRPYAAFVTSNDELDTGRLWGRLGTEAERLLDGFVKLPSNLYWTFWEELTSIDQYRKGVPWKPDTPGNLSFGAIKGAFDFIFRLVPQGEASTAYFRNPPGNNENYGKTRDDWRAGIRVPDVVPGFRLDRLVGLLKQTMTIHEFNNNQQPTNKQGD
jgi:hypothetical protein